MTLAGEFRLSCNKIQILMLIVLFEFHHFYRRCRLRVCRIGTHANISWENKSIQMYLGNQLLKNGESWHLSVHTNIVIGDYIVIRGKQAFGKNRQGQFAKRPKFA